MNEEEDLKEAFHDVMVRSSPPSPMDPARALDQGRRVRKRRRVAWAGAAVVTLTVGAVAGPALISNLPGNGSAGQQVASGPSTTKPGPTSASTLLPTTAPTTRKTGDPWPEGQTDRTASAGPRAVRAVSLMTDLSSSVPPGFSTPDLKYPGGRPMRYPQAQYASSDGEQDYWEYHAIIPVQKDDRVGRLMVQSTTPNGKPATNPCKVAQGLWSRTGTCTIVDVDGQKVGVVTARGSGDFDQWAAYRHTDGTVVFLAQAKQIVDDPARKPLTQPVFTPRQLAELVISPKFKISD